MPTPRPPMARTPMARPPAPRAAAYAADDNVDTMKVAGILMCVLALVSVGLSFLGKTKVDSEDRLASIGGSFMVLLFGAALVQGVGAVRTFMLVMCGLGALAGGAAIVVVNQNRVLQVLMVGVFLSCAGYLALLYDQYASRTRAVVGVVLVLAGAAVGLSTQTWLAAFARRGFAAELRPLLSPDRSYEDKASGLSVEPPAGWSLLQENAGLFSDVPAKVRLADADAGIVAFINDEPKPVGFSTLDAHLDQALERLKQSELEPKENGRRDTTVGKASARRMSIDWTYEGLPFSGFLSVWLDGPRLFTIFGAAVGGWSSGTEERFRALEDALKFSAPVESALSEAQTRLTQVCPLFTQDAIRLVGRRIPPASPTETYFRTAWGFAIRGQGQMDPVTATELRELMGAVFAKMPEADRQRFSGYTERLRARGQTTAAEDAAAMAILGRAASALDADSLSRLRNHVDQLITAGGLL